MKSRFKGALHLHTTFSDGEFTLEALKDHFKKRGFQFLLMSDHAEGMDAGKMSDYVSLCRALSEPDFCIVPGLEFSYTVERAGSLHLLGYGVAEFQREEEPVAMIHAIHRLGGLAVLAHPFPPLYPAILPLTPYLDGIELWNTKYNGRFAPSLWSCALFSEIRTARPEVLGFYGTDYHWKSQYAGMALWAEADALTPSALLTALSKGSYHAEIKEERFMPDGNLTPSQEARFARVERIYRIWKKIIVGGRTPFKMLRLPVPPKLKALARKVL